MTMRVFVFLLATTSMCCFNTFAQTNTCTKGIESYAVKKYAAAIYHFTECLRYDKSNAHIYYNRGNAYLNLGNLDKGLKDLKKANKLDSEIALPYYALAVYHMSEREPEKALSWMDKGVNQFPEDPVFYNYRGWINFQIENYALSFKDFNKAIELDSMYASAYNNRGSARYKSQDIAEAHRNDLLMAKADYERALSLDPGLDYAYRNLGYIYYLLDELKDATQYLDHAHELFPHDPMVFYYRAQLQRKLGRIDLALADLDSALLLAPKLGGAYFEKALIRVEENKRDEAKDLFVKAAQVNSDYQGKSYVEIARFHARDGSLETMLEFLKLARQSGYFEHKGRHEKFLADSDFNQFRNESAYLVFQESLRK